MKKIAALLVIFISMMMPLHAGAQGANWVALQSDTTTLTAPGQVIQLSLMGSLDTPINGAALILRYDPACFKITGHQPGSLIPGATAFVQDNPGQFDLTYFFQGKGNGQTGEGSLITIQLEALQLCASDLSAAPETITLGVLDDKGLAFNLAGVEYRSLVAHIAPGPGLEVVTPQPAGGVPAISINPAAGSKPTFNFLLIILPIILLSILSAILVFFLRSPSKQPGKSALTKKTGPALVLGGRSIPIARARTQLGRYAEIVQREEGFYLINAGSPKGIFLNGKRLTDGYYPLHNGDQVQLGKDISYRFVGPGGQTI